MYKLHKLITYPVVLHIILNSIIKKDIRNPLFFLMRLIFQKIIFIFRFFGVYF